jgi:hypothetical protein
LVLYKGLTFSFNGQTFLLIVVSRLTKQKYPLCPPVSVVKNIIVDKYCEGANKLNQFQIFIIRAVIGAVFAVVLTRMFYGKVHIAYVVGLAIIMVGLAYFAEYLRKRKTR